MVDVEPPNIPKLLLPERYIILPLVKKHDPLLLKYFQLLVKYNKNLLKKNG